ncbi:hypothetical protein BDM02DRAFT_3273676 [Thelephora ganbajun]|uniref:Uncharacterized protein n=1 Tax=Thelephora ganbajun TaxID=370292 RepID=A0ACB6YWI7_THEGA|nr:hypothetical protein BDM02DRAFT_3273676 [Thelephora ganbajun]
MPEGCPRITVPDSAEDSVILSEMIHTSRFPARNKVPKFTIFISPLRMTTNKDHRRERFRITQTLSKYGSESAGAPRRHAS